MIMANEFIADGVYLVGCQNTKLLDGAWVSEAGTYLVTDETKLSLISDANPGDIAFTAGYARIWQLDTDSTTWVELPQSSAVEAAGAAEDAAETATAAATTAQTVAASIPQNYSDLSAKVNDIAYISGTYSATLIQKINVTIPAGEYIVSVDNITSTDTDRDVCLVNFDSGNGSTMLYFPRGKNHAEIVTLPNQVTHVYLYASDNISRSSGDSFTFKNFVVKRVDHLSKAFMVNFAKEMVSTADVSNSNKTEIDRPIYKGQKICVLVSKGGKGYWIGFGNRGISSNYQQPTHVSGDGLTKITASADYQAVYLLFDSSVTAAKVTVYVDGTEKRYNNFSILGDSISTFNDFIPSGNLSWYPNDATINNNDCTDVTNTWWYRFARDYNCALQANESYSGAPICNDGYGAGTTDASDKSFVARMANLPQSDLLLVFGGANDSWNNVSIGDYKYSGWTAEDLSAFRPAMAYMLDYLTKHHVGAKIVFIKYTDLSSDISDSIDTICDHYGIDCLVLADTIQKAGGHPNTAGMADIAAQLIDHLVNAG